MSTDDERAARMREFKREFAEAHRRAGRRRRRRPPSSRRRRRHATSVARELRELVNELVDDRIRELLGESRRVPIGLVAQRSGISADALRMRCRRLQIKTVREGRIVTIAIGDVERLLGTTTQD